MLVASVTFGAGIVWLLGGYLIGFVALVAWSLCRAAKLGDEQEIRRSWIVEDDEVAWEPWPGERAA